MRIGQSDSSGDQAPRFDHQAHVGEADGMNLIEIVEIDQRVLAIGQIAAGQFCRDKWMDAELVGINQALQL